MVYFLLFAAILTACITAIAFPKKGNVDADNSDTNNEEIVKIPLEKFDNYFSRSAGRYCAHCGIHGSHHTDRHNDYANLLLSKIV